MVRRIVQLSFLLLTLVGVYVFQAHCEIWCPMGGVESLYAYIHDGSTPCSVGVSNFFILGAVLLTTVLVRRVFCGYACPLGAIAEWLRGVGRFLRLPEVRVSGRADGLLRWLKYPVLAVILYYTIRTGELVFRGYDPCYALISRHGEDITVWAYTISGAIVFASLFITIPFCRWFCPLAAVMNPLSRFGLVRVARNADTCIDCSRCTRACPSAIPVDQQIEVTQSRCTGCLECVQNCPRGDTNTLGLHLPATLRKSASKKSDRRLPVWSQQAMLSLLLIASLTAAVVYVTWNPMPSFVKSRGELASNRETLELRIDGLSCRGTANRLWGFFLDRDDLFQLNGPLRLEAWPGPGTVRARITFDPKQTSASDIRRAITEPYFNLSDDPMNSRIETSPFMIEGYDPLALPDDFEFEL